MDQETDRLYPSAPSENVGLEQRLEKKLNYVNSFNNSIINKKEMIVYFRERNRKSKKKYKNHKTLITLLKSFDTFVIIATTSRSITLSLTEVGLIAIPISTATACGLSIGNKVIYEININKHNKYKKQYDKDQQTIKCFDKLYRKSLQDNVFDKNEFESLCNIFTKYFDENKNESFYKYEHKSRIKLF